MNDLYNSAELKNNLQAQNYQRTNKSAFRYLAYKNMQSIIQKYVQGNQVLDYGAGTGISTQFLLDLNSDFNITGLDVSKEMLKIAEKNCPLASFHTTKNYESMKMKNQFDLIFSSFVLFEIDSLTEIIKYLNFAKNLMNKDSIFIAITGSEELYKKDWYIWKTDYLCNKKLKSGDKAKLLLNKENIEFTDFYWTKKDYLDCFKKVGFDVISIHTPLGDLDDPFPWKDELTISPFIIFVAKK